MDRNVTGPSRPGINRAGHRQSGLSLLGFLIVLAVVGVFIYMGMKLVPMYSEYYSVKQAMKSLANEPDIASQDSKRIEDLFFRKLYVSYAENVKPENVTVKRLPNGAGWNMTVNYELRKPLIANLDVVGKFNASQDLTKRDGTD